MDPLVSPPSQRFIRRQQEEFERPGAGAQLCALLFISRYILLKSRFLTVAMETQPHRDPSHRDTLLKWFFFFFFAIQPNGKALIGLVYYYSYYIYLHSPPWNLLNVPLIETLSPRTSSSTRGPWAALMWVL